MDPEPPDGPRSIGEIAVYRGEVPRLPALPPLEPKLSDGLGRLIEAARQPHPDVGLRDVFLPDHLRAEAKTALDRYDQLIVPASVQRVFDWLFGVNARLANQVSRADVLARAVAYADSLIEIPEVCFNADTRREAELKLTWFPSAAEVYEILRPATLGLHAKRHALRRLLNTPSTPPPPAELTEEERAAILSDFNLKLEAVRAERMVEAEAARPDPTPRYLTRGQLRLAYAEQQRHENPLVAAGGRHRLRMLGEDVPEPVREVAPTGWEHTEDADNPW